MLFQVGRERRFSVDKLPKAIDGAVVSRGNRNAIIPHRITIDIQPTCCLLISPDSLTLAEGKQKWPIAPDCCCRLALIVFILTCFKIFFFFYRV